MFQFPGFAQESRDQCLFDSFPGLIAAFHAYHRLLAPRHPPHALRSLTTKIHALPANRKAEPWKIALVTAQNTVLPRRSDNLRFARATGRSSPNF
jgi:hypothetical protein